MESPYESRSTYEPRSCGANMAEGVRENLDDMMRRKKRGRGVKLRVRRQAVEFVVVVGVCVAMLCASKPRHMSVVVGRE